jgi:hypothetical protein
MKQMTQSLEGMSAVELGRWMGRREAFAAVAGKCSAAEAESLQRIRQDKIYLQLDPSWEEFCTKRLGTSRRHVDRTLRLLEEFGPAYFHVAQMAHVTAEEYRAIAPHVSGDGVRLDGAVIALLPENSEQVSSAVAELLEREKPVKEKAPLSFEVVIKRCEALEEAVFGLDGSLEPIQRMRLTTAISRLRRAAAEKGANTL